MHPATERVQTFLEQHGKHFTVKDMPASTRTAADAAETIGCGLAQIAKSLVFRDQGADRAVLVIASGGNRVATSRVEAGTGLSLSKADADFVRAKTGFAIGGVAPVAHSTEVLTILDPDLQQHEVIWAAAGTPKSVFALTPDELGRLTGGQWLALAE